MVRLCLISLDGAFELEGTPRLPEVASPIAPVSRDGKIKRELAAIKQREEEKRLQKALERGYVHQPKVLDLAPLRSALDDKRARSTARLP